MKTIGLIGGMSWESTVTYYQALNLMVKREMGGLHSAKLLLHSVDFAGIEAYQASGDWDAAARELAQAAQGLVRAGADFIVICTNTMHKVAPQIEQAAGVPVLHIADATAQALKAAGITRVALLGTKYTMTQDFYRERLTAAGVETLIPDADGVELVNDVIYNELCLGQIREQSRAAFVSVIEELERRGAQGVILGCTEIGLLIRQKDVRLPVFDTTLIHAEAAAMLAMSQEPLPAPAPAPEPPKKKRSPLKFIVPAVALAVVILAFVAGVITFAFGQAQRQFEAFTGAELPESARISHYKYTNSGGLRDVECTLRIDADDSGQLISALLDEGFTEISMVQSGGRMIPVTDLLHNGQRVIACLVHEIPGTSQTLYLTESGSRISVHYTLSDA